jgi:hypothetical protein
MLRITILDTPNRRRLVLEGKLMAPWAAELRNECREAAADLRGRELVIERSSGVFTKHVMKRLARKIRGNVQEQRDDDQQY